MRVNSSIKAVLRAGVLFLFLSIQISTSLAQQIPRCVAPPPGMISWWTGDSDASDLQNNNHGVLVNGAIAGAPGQVDGAFSFDGVNDYIEVPDSDDQKPASITIDGWFNLTSAPGNLAILANKYQPPGVFQGWILFVDKFLRPGFGVHRPPNVITEVGQNVVIPPNSWTHIAATYNGGTGVVRMYINGSLTDSDTLIGGYQPATTPMKIGAATWFSGGFMDGLADEVEVFNRALSDAEIQSIYDAGSAGKCKFNEPSLATFTVDKQFMDGNDATPITFNIQCNDGLPLNSSLTVLPDVSGKAEVTFVVELFDPGALDCTVWEDDIPNYTPSYECGLGSNSTALCNDGDSTSLDSFGVGPCIFEAVDSAVADTSRNFCTIRNYPDSATFTVNKDWIVIGSGGDLVEQLASIQIWCDAEIPGGTLFGGNWYRTFEDTGDFNPSVTIVPDYPSSNCWAEETILDDAVETENNCDGDLLDAGGSASCDIINTVLYEGIPALNKYGLALLALLMLGIGAVGIRRFA